MSEFLRYDQIIKERVYQAVGLVAMITYQSLGDSQVLLVKHRGYNEKVQEGQWGLPSETLCYKPKTNNHHPCVESLYAALIRLGGEELGVDLRNFSFLLTKDRILFQTNWRFNGRGQALAQVLSLHLDCQEYRRLQPSLGLVQGSREVSESGFFPLDEVFNQRIFLRDNTLETLQEARRQDFFNDQNEQRRVRLARVGLFNHHRDVKDLILYETDCHSQTWR